MHVHRLSSLSSLHSQSRSSADDSKQSDILAHFEKGRQPEHHHRRKISLAYHNTLLLGGQSGYDWLHTPFLSFQSVLLFMFMCISCYCADINAKGVILKAFEQYGLKTCIHFTPWKREENYISVFKGSGRAETLTYRDPHARPFVRARVDVV